MSRTKLRTCKYLKRLCLGNSNFSNNFWKEEKTLSKYRSLNVIIPSADHWVKVLSISEGGKAKFAAIGEEIEKVCNPK